MFFLEMAWGNLLRNRRRTLSTLTAIAIGVSMVILTNGVTGGISANMSDALVNQIDGHLHVQHRDYKKYFITDQEKILIPDYRALSAEIMKNPHVRAVMPRVMMGGLISKDDKTTTFFGFGSDLSTLKSVLPDYGKNLVAGNVLSADDPDGVLVGRALANSLGLKVGDELVLLSKTVHGDSSNALVHVRGVVTFPQDDILEKSLVFTGLGKTLKENLLDLGDGATQLLVRIDDIKNVPLVEVELNRRFETLGMPWRVTPWYDNAVFSRIVGMFGGIGSLISIILVLMVGVITSNALLMAFFERIREIGTLRAIGMRKLDVYGLLYVESAMVGVGGAVLGLVFGVALVMLGRYLGIPLGGIVNQEIRPVLSVASLAVSVAAPIVCIVVAAAIPIRAVSRMSVIESLNHH
ncbi:MAG: ABC transporter permease [Betaproteobacteria bacterium]|nr:ABC transporter permease [Betaproteobacteria bacterium]MBI3806315.1 ABC transporter permease [Nitrospirota bacterium]